MSDDDEIELRCRQCDLFSDCDLYKDRSDGYLYCSVCWKKFYKKKPPPAAKYNPPKPLVLKRTGDAVTDPANALVDTYYPDADEEHVTTVFAENDCAWGTNMRRLPRKGSPEFTILQLLTNGTEDFTTYIRSGTVGEAGRVVIYDKLSLGQAKKKFCALFKEHTQNSWAAVGGDSRKFHGKQGLSALVLPSKPAPASAAVASSPSPSPTSASAAPAASEENAGTAAETAEEPATAKTEDTVPATTNGAAVLRTEEKAPEIPRKEEPKQEEPKQQAELPKSEPKKAEPVKQEPKKEEVKKDEPKKEEAKKTEQPPPPPAQRPQPPPPPSQKPQAPPKREEAARRDTNNDDDDRTSTQPAANMPSFTKREPSPTAEAKTRPPPIAIQKKPYQAEEDEKPSSNAATVALIVAGLAVAVGAGVWAMRSRKA